MKLPGKAIVRATKARIGSEIFIVLGSFAFDEFNIARGGYLGFAVKRALTP